MRKILALGFAQELLEIFFPYIRLFLLFAYWFYSYYFLPY